MGNRDETLFEQELVCQSYAKARGYEVVAVFAEIGSSKKFGRWGLQTLFDFCKKEPVVAVITQNVGRLARSPLDLERIKSTLSDAGVEIECLETVTPVGKHEKVVL